MKIGVDAKWFHTGHPSGRVFTRNLLSRLVAKNPDVVFTLFMNSRDREKETPFQTQNVECVYSSFSTNLLSNVALLPFIAGNRGLDILVTQNFAAPIRGIPQMTIVFDIIFRTHPEFFTAKERAYFWFIKPLLRFADDVTSISQFALDEMNAFGFVRKHQSSHVLLLGVDEHFFPTGNHQGENEIEAFRIKYGLPARYILYVGRLNQRKNLDTLLRALLHLKDQTATLVVCGSRDWRMFDFEKVVAELGLQSRVVQLGHIADSELPVLYRAATVFAYVPFKEGFGLPPLEAMASGVPVVVSSTSSLPEVCGEAGCYVNPLDAKSIAAGLDSVLSDSKLRSEMIDRGFKRARALSWDRAADRFMTIVNEVVTQQL